MFRLLKLAEVGVALIGLTVFAAWAIGGLVAVLVLAAVFTAVLPWLVRDRPAAPPAAPAGEGEGGRLGR